MSRTFKTAVVTGASRGFGRAIAAALVAAGTDVVGIARDGNELHAVRNELGESFTPVTADASAKAAIRYISGYAAEESERGALDIRFITLLPQLTPATSLGAVGVEGYAARQGVDQNVIVDGLQPILTPDHVAKAVVDLTADPDSASEYQLSGAGLRPIG